MITMDYVSADHTCKSINVIDLHSLYHKKPCSGTVPTALSSVLKATTTIISYIPTLTSIQIIPSIYISTRQYSILRK